MTIVPDTKDWTWVLQRVCPACAFDAATFPPEAVSAAVRTQAAVWQELLDHPLADMRPSPDTWSALEYGCHVRDVFVLYQRRLQMMLTRDHPTFANWDQDVTAVDDRYHEQDPEVVAVQVAVAAASLADSFDTVDGVDWQRTGERSDGAVFSVATFAQYMIHDPVHHVYDVKKGYEALQPESG